MADNRNNNNENKNNAEVNVNINRPAKRMWTECNPLDQPEGTYRYALNAIKGTEDGNENFLATEASNDEVIIIDNLLGTGYLGNGETLLFSVDVDGNSLIGILDKNNVYTNLITTTSFNFDLNHQIGCEIRIIKNSQRVAYWVDGVNDAFHCNIDALDNYWTQDYLNYLNNGGDPLTYAFDRWNGEAFNLISKYSSIPQFTDVTIIPYGNILPGSYNFAIQYLDSDLNPTEWITTSNTVNIYNDRVDAAFESIRGSRNIKNDLQWFGVSNKSIQIKVDNLDVNFQFFRIAIIQCAFNTGQTFKVLTTDPININAGGYTYTGNDVELTTIDITEVQASRNNIKKPKYIAQLENRLLLANGADVNFPFCTFQTYASQTKTDLCNHETILNSTLDTSNPKNPKSTFFITGYMPGEVYAFGIVYIMDDLSESPVFHIPGPSPVDGSATMFEYECTSGYSDIHTCGLGEDYWGNDYLGNPLLGQKIRHNKFPFRSQLDQSLYFLAETLPGPTSILQYQENIVVTLTGVYPIQNGQPAVISFQVRYKLKDIPSVFIVTVTLTQSLLLQPIVFYTGDLELDTTYTINSNLDTLYPATFTEAYNTTTTVLGAVVNATFSKLLGINFSNIIQPPNTIGFYIVRVERTETDRFVLDNGIIGPTTKYQSKYNCVSRLYPQVYPFNFMIIPGIITGASQKPYSQTLDVSDDSFWVFSPQHQFFNDKTKPNNIQIEGTYQPILVRYPSSPDNLYDGHNGGPYNPPGWYSVTGHGTFTTLTDYDKWGIYVLGTQAGTNYNTAASAEKFDVWVPYKVMDFKYYTGLGSTCGADFRIGTLIPVNKSYYLNAADYQVDTVNANTTEITYYNAMCDNKIAIMTCDFPTVFLFENICASPITGGNPSERIFLNFYSNNPPYLSSDMQGSRAPTGGGGLPAVSPTVYVPNYWDLMYVTMLTNTQDIYSNFLTRTYYKEHNNVIYFSDLLISSENINLFNGDVKIAEFNPINSCFIGFKNKHNGAANHTWQIIAGVILLVAAVVVTIVTDGVGTPLVALAVTTLAGLAVSYGIALIQSGLKYNAMQKMIQYDYSNGLLQAIGDTEIQLIFNNQYGGYSLVGASVQNMGVNGFNPSNNQPVYTWYSEMLRGLYIETSASSALRSGITATGTDFMLTADNSNQFIYTNLENYIRDKFTTVDVEQGSGRLFRGYPYTEIYDLNLDYTRQNHQKQFYCLPINYDCCTKDPFDFPNRVWYSQQSFQEETIDNYRIFLPNNYRDVESEHGPITNIFKQSDQLYVHTREALWLLPKNQQERVTDQISSFVGTGDFFNIPPKLVNDDLLGSAGSQHSVATCKTKKGIFYVNELESKVYWMGRNTNMYSISYPEIISNIGNETWFKNNMGSQFAALFYAAAGFDYPFLNNPASKNGLGYLSVYDNYYNRILLTKKDVIPRYALTIAINPDIVTPDMVYFITETQTWYFLGTEIFLDDTTYFLNASWTISFSIDDMAWISMHSYTPSVYFNNQNRYFSWNNIDTILNIHLLNGSYLTFGGNFYPFIIDYVSLSNPLTVRTWDTILLNTVCREYFEQLNQFVVIPTITFQQAVFYNSRQSSGLQNLVVKDLQTPTTRYMQQQVVNTTEELLIANRENYWRINEIRDYVANYTVPLFIGNQYSTTDYYTIDKIVNTAVINYTKNWYNREDLRDRYMQIRLFYTVDSDTNIYNLMVCYSIEFEKVSTR